MARDTETAARLAVGARDAAAGAAQAAQGETVRVFGCLPPLCESHRPDLAVAFLEKEGEDFVRDTYRGIAEALVRGGPVDGFIVETANTWAEVECAVAALQEADEELAHGLPVIISMQGALLCPETLTPQPHTAAELAQRALQLKLGPRQLPLEAFGFNCAPPEAIIAALDAVRAAGLHEELAEADVGLAAYANIVAADAIVGGDGGYDMGSFVHPGVRPDQEGPRYLHACEEFIARGVTHCGGCCEVTPQQIAALAERFSLVTQ